MTEEFEEAPAFVEDTSGGGGVPLRCGGKRLGKGADASPTHPVLVEHDGDGTFVPRHAALLQAGKEAVLLLAVVTPVGKALEELDEWGEGLDVNASGAAGGAQGKLEAVENLEDDHVLFAETTCAFHLARSLSGACAACKL